MQELLARIASTPCAIEAAIAQIIEMDSALAIQTLKLACAGAGKTEAPASISEAIARIGLDRVGMCAFAAIAASRSIDPEAAKYLIRNICATAIAIAMPEHDNTVATHLDLAAYLLTRWGAPLQTIEALTRPVARVVDYQSVGSGRSVPA
jgi:hypothetical protein